MSIPNTASQLSTNSDPVSVGVDTIGQITPSTVPGAIILPHHGVWPRIAEDAFIAPGAVIIGDVEIGPLSNIWFGCVVRGDVHEIRIGARTNIQDGTVIHVTGGKYGTYIGDDITIGHKALLHACTLDNGCFIGMGATVMDGAVVEAAAMVGAAALITPGKRVGAKTLWAGSPGKEKRALSESELAYFPVSAQKYVNLAATYRGVDPVYDGVTPSTGVS